MSAGHEMHTVTGIDNRKFAMWSLIASECFLFGTLMTNYLINRDRVLTGPKATDVYNIDLTTASTFILLMSSVAMVFALQNCRLKNAKGFRLSTAVVVLGGLLFLGCQVYEFTHFVHEGLGLSTSVFASSFYMLTGCHGAHVFVGVLWQLTLLVTSYKRGDKWFDPDLVEVAGLYWHFVDVIWIIIFTVVYLFAYLT